MDLFTGNLTLRYLDVFLPGPNGLNVEVWRVYNSKIFKDRKDGQSASVQAEHKSWVGIGWTMHMGRIYDPDSANPVIEFPDGRREPLYLDNYGTNKHISRDFLKYDKTSYKLYFKNGVVWTFGLSTTVYFGDGTYKITRVVTKIENSFGHAISITYKVYNSKYLPVMSKIVDSMGREITFISTDENYPKLQKIKIKNYAGNDVYFNYTVTRFSNGFYKLDSFQPPALPAIAYQYDPSFYELTKVTTGFGGILEFVYNSHDFYFSGIHLRSRVVSQKKITFTQGGDQKVWSFYYPDYNGAVQGTTTVAGPEYNVSFTHYGYDASSPWKIGLIKEWSYGDGSYSEKYDWDFQEISNNVWTVLGISMGTAKAPLLSSVETIRAGDSNLKTEYLYERIDTKRYGLPTKINYFVNGSINPKYYTELEYFYESQSSFRDAYMFDFVFREIKRSAGGDMLGKTEIYYYTDAGRKGAIDKILKYKKETEYFTWDYDYSCSDPNLVVISIKNPGNDVTVTHKYSYGVQSDYSDGTAQITRQISSYDSSIISETNQHGGTINYTYDDAGRIIRIDRPDPFNDTYFQWLNTENRVDIAQGGNVITKFWDGFGRDLGYIETGGGITLYYLKELDSEGRVISENAGGTDKTQKYSYQYDNFGRLTKIINPLGKATLISYEARRKIITDAEQHSTIYEYDDLPGLPTRVIDAMGNQAVHTYDPLGRLINVNYNGTRTHTYVYDWLDNLVSESHPETGLISYVYDNSLRLSQRIWGNSKQIYSYSSGRLSQISSYKNNSSSPDETIRYIYDLKGRVSSIYGSNWSRKNITYNIWGSITSETLSILGLADKTISYQYNGNNLLTSITYPSGRVATTSYNALNLPAFLSFNGKTIIDSITYGQGGLPTNISIAGNGTVYSANYLATGYLASESLKKGGITLYDASYSYDGVGNITAINSTTPAPALNATFNYDALYRLTSATYSTGRVNNYTYEYDPYGNMFRVAENGVTVFEKTYDSQNRIIGFSYDDRGNLLYANGKYFNWDGFNRLSSILSSSGEILGQYTYDDRGLRLKAIPPLPEINIKQNNIDIPDGGTVSFKIVSQEDKIFIVENTGLANLNLGNLTLSGPNADQFQIIQQPASVVSPGSSTSFVVRFSPTSSGLKIASLSLANNDLDENPYEITLYGNYEPEINIIGIPNGGSYNFGTVTIGDFVRANFTIQNLGTAPLHLTGTPPVAISGKNPGNFSVEMQPQTIIEPGQSSTFEVQFTSTGNGIYTADLYIANDDTNENPYIIHLSGSGAIGPASLIETSGQDGLVVTFPAGEEKLLANTLQTITWKADKDINFVRIEYSTDNGSTYRIITERTPNTGKYEWLVPSDISRSWLIRISDADRYKPISDSISIEFSFKIKKSEDFFKLAPTISSIITIPDKRRQAYLKLSLDIIPFEAKRLFQISANNVWTKAEGYDVFLDRWHKIKIDINPNISLASVWLDNEPLLEYVGLKLEPMMTAANSSGAIVFSHGGEAGSAILIDDMEVKVLDPDSNIDYENAEQAPLWKRLFTDDFENYQDEVEVYKAGGWTEILESNPQPAAYLGDEAEQDYIFNRMRGQKKALLENQLKINKNHIKLDEQDAFSGFKSLRISSLKGKRLSFVKTFSLPEQAPFAISQKNFTVVEKLSDLVSLKDLRRQKRADVNLNENAGRKGNGILARGNNQFVVIDGSSGQRATGGSGKIKTMSVGATGIYYIYAFDGRLLAEYDGYGVCLREYTYIGAKMVAEYQPSQGKYLYCATHQINSIRIVTDDMSNVYCGT